MLKLSGSLPRTAGFVSDTEECYKRIATSGVVSMERDRTYFMRRAAQERSAATNATGKAREVHRQMADRYKDLVRSGEPAEQPASS